MTARPAPDGFCSCPPVGDGVTSFSLDCGIGSHRDRARIPVARPAPDSRVERLATWFTRQHGTVDDHREAAGQLVAMLESAGLLVVDPDNPDDAVVNRIMAIWTGDEWLPLSARFGYARAVLAALAAPGGEPT